MGQDSSGEQCQPAENHSEKHYFNYFLSLPLWALMNNIFFLWLLMGRKKQEFDSEHIIEQHVFPDRLASRSFKLLQNPTAAK